MECPIFIQLHLCIIICTGFYLNFLFPAIMQQYQDSIKNHKAGKPVAFDELPTPPGYAPIPGVATPDDTPADSPSVGQVSKH